jgi:glycosyltransferase involved in cell wall biosynthesis
LILQPETEGFGAEIFIKGKLMFNSEYLKSSHSTEATEKFDVICLSHLRWDFVYQRPQHLLSRFARHSHRVFFFEEPIFTDEQTRLETGERENNLFVLQPHISHYDRENRKLADIQREMLNEFINSQKIKNFVLWFYTPMAMDFAAHLEPVITVFDCMDELSAFKFAPPELIENEKRLLEKADLVFTGGHSLYEAKKDRHERVFAFPSSIDVAHFNQARSIKEEPEDQKRIPHPRLGYCGVIDERLDTVLLAEMADLRPEWQFVMIGPVVKISEEDLPRRQNIHYLGGKDYKDLPAYISGWDIALMPFAMNESTRYISPTKTPEYLAAGKPVISTPIRDVVRPYGEQKLVEIAGTAEGFVAAGDKILQLGNLSEWQARVDEFLAHMSWDQTWEQMSELIEKAIDREPQKSKQAV